RGSREEHENGNEYAETKNVVHRGPPECGLARNREGAKFRVPSMLPRNAVCTDSVLMAWALFLR
ncbi:MAG: hypothetical protein WBN70_19640, partial [Polyangiales bacterium]